MTKPTPTPWVLTYGDIIIPSIHSERHIGGSTDDDADRNKYAFTITRVLQDRHKRFDHQANARLIVRAVNSHAAMVATLESIRDRSSEPVPTDKYADLARDLLHIHGRSIAALDLASEGEG